MDIKCIIAIGNPGVEYNGTRHNVAQRVFLELEKMQELGWQKKSKLRAEIGFWSNTTSKKKVMLVKPDVYMNESGISVRSICDYFRLLPSDLMIIHDELDLPPGKLKLQIGGRASGHRGVLSIQKMLGNTQFIRLRLGIGHPRSYSMNQSVSSFVLEKPSITQEPMILEVVKYFCKNMDLLFEMEVMKANSFLQQKLI